MKDGYLFAALFCFYKYRRIITPYRLASPMA